METINWSLRPHSAHEKCGEKENPMTNSDLDRSMRLKLAIEELLKDIDMSGEEWNDYDKDGVAYWEKWDK
jgi:hypothetical protein